MNRLLDLLAGYVGAKIERGIKEAVSPVVPYVRGVATGLAFIVASAPLFSLALISVAGALFASLAGHAEFVAPALWTGLIFALLGVLVLSIGLGMVRRPRR